ncbi:hypothetical protein R8Z50_31725 [Longispora sp. K20-0274]|uniref:hypothetical protein n=1 Tax=Longispora sp. K20-0274 TaxID=3088255 RepID=UPI00399BE15D
MTVTGRDGRRWRVRRRWLPWRPKNRLDGVDWITDMPSFGDIDHPILLLLFLLVLFPVLLIAAIFLAEVLILLLIVPVLVIARTAFGVPWTVTAKSGGDKYAAEVSGWGPSRDLIERTRAEIEATGWPQSMPQIRGMARRG